MTGAKIVNPRDFYYTNGEYANFYTKDGRPILFDDSHLTYEACGLIMDFLEPQLRETFINNKEHSNLK